MSTPTNLVSYEEALAGVQQTDFRAANLFRMVAARIAPGDVIDVGSGAGGLVADLLSRGVDARGIDSNAAMVAAAKKHLETRELDAARITQSTIEELLARGAQADTVTCMDCLEHVEDDRAFFDRLAALVRPGGRLIITVPAMSALYGPRDKAVGHFRRYDPPALRTLARHPSLTLRELRYWNLLGVVPVFVSQRVLHRQLDESFRFGEPTPAQHLLRHALQFWFRTVENRVRPPRGLTLIMVLEKNANHSAPRETTV